MFAVPPIAWLLGGAFVLWVLGRPRLMFPIPGGKAGSGFGLRMHPILGYPKLHEGMDIPAKTGLPIFAAEAGTVIYAGERGGYGLMVEIDHGDHFVTRYGHMSRIMTTKGATVIRGQTIGLVGSTGLSTGPHLHFETRVRGVPMDPALYL